MEAAWVFAALSTVCLGLFVYPYVLYPAVLRRLTARPVHPAPTTASVSLLFCAYNEIETLPAKLANLRQLKANHPGLEILAYDDASSDGTSERLASVPDLLTLVRGAGRTGKAAGMKRLAAQAGGEILVFTDANVLLSPDAIQRLLPYYGDPEVGGVCGTLHYVDDPSSVTAQVGSLYWNIDEKLRSRESATGNVMGADGSLFSVRKSLYPRFPDTVLDDFTVSMSVVFAGKRLIKAADVNAFERSVARRSEELRRKVRIGARAYHTHAYLRPQLRRMPPRDRFKYVSHKVIRWFGGLFLGAGAVFGFLAVAALSPLAAGILVLAVLGAVGLAVSSPDGVQARAGEVLLSTIATFVGVVQGMRGRTVVTWAPAKSR